MLDLTQDRNIERMNPERLAEIQARHDVLSRTLVAGSLYATDIEATHHDRATLLREVQSAWDQAVSARDDSAQWEIKFWAAQATIEDLRTEDARLMSVIVVQKDEIARLEREWDEARSRFVAAFWPGWPITTTSCAFCKNRIPPGAKWRKHHHDCPYVRDDQKRTAPRRPNRQSGVVYAP